jgi:pyruvate dehydrogenase E2 component (dihydrolipoamide acetyltransferase)
MTTQIINIPDLGEAEDVEVIEICVKTGDIVDSEAPILVLESDKAAMEIPASIAGTVISLKVLLGDKVGAGTPFLEIEVPKEIRPLKEEVAPLIESETSKESEINPLKQETNLNTLNERSTPSSVTGNSSVYAGPAVRKLAREFGIQLSLVNPSGPRGRIQKEDLHLFVKERLSGASKSAFQFSQPNVDYSKWGPVAEHQLTRFQKSSLTNLHTSWINIPHVTQHDECDLGLLLDLRAKLNKKHQMNIPFHMS